MGLAVQVDMVSAGIVEEEPEPAINDDLLSRLEEIFDSLEARKGLMKKQAWVRANLGLFNVVTSRRREALEVYFFQAESVLTYKEAGRLLGISGTAVSTLLSDAFRTAQQRLERRLFGWAQGLTAEHILEQPALILGALGPDFKEAHPEVRTVSDFCRLDEAEQEAVLGPRYTRVNGLLLDKGISSSTDA